MSTVNCTGTTKSQTFPAGTVDTAYSLTLSGGPAGYVPETKTNAFSPAQNFTGLSPGNYTLTCTKNGVSTSIPVVVAVPVTLQVPDVLSVTVS